MRSVVKIVILSILFTGGTGEGTTPVRLQSRFPREVAGHRILKVLDRYNSYLGSPPTSHISPLVSFEDSRHRFWFGTSQGDLRLAMYDDESGRWMLYSDRALPSATGVDYSTNAVLPSDISAIAESGDGRLWFSGKYTGSPYPMSQSGSACPDFTYLDGLQWGKASPDLTHYGGVENIGVFAGRRGRVWLWRKFEVESYDAGRWSGAVKLDHVLPGAPKLCYITAGLESADGRVWLQTYQGVVRSDGSRQKWTWYPKIPAQCGDTIYEDHRRRIWFIAFRSVMAYDPSSDSVSSIRLPNQGPLTGDSLYATAVCQDQEGRMLFGFRDGDGLGLYEQSAGEWRWFDLEPLGLSNSVSSIVEDDAERIWIVTPTGIAILEA